MCHEPKIDGISMVPTLLGDTDNQQQKEYLYWEFHAQGGKQAVRKGPWKAVRLGVRADRNSPIELTYNLDEDISEQNDIAGQHPEIVDDMNRIMKEAHVPSELFPLFDD
jgi:arylsulfatase A